MRALHGIHTYIARIRRDRTIDFISVSLHQLPVRSSQCIVASNLDVRRSNIVPDVQHRIIIVLEKFSPPQFIERHPSTTLVHTFTRRNSHMYMLEISESSDKMDSIRFHLIGC